MPEQAAPDGSQGSTGGSGTAPGQGTVRGRGTVKVGVVTSDRMTKTIVVSVERLVKHPKYKRFVKQTSRFMAHDEKNECRVGDTVEITESRPLSARKRWRVRRIVTRMIRPDEVLPAAADEGSSR